MHWLALLAAGLIEIVFALSLSRAQGLTHPGWVATFVVAGAISLLLLQYAMRVIPIGTAYAVWTGIGAAGTAVAGIVLLDESVGATRVLCIVLIVVAVLGLQLTSAGHG
jgi:quaternary ammonium compound-resistance protein SugE